jgi:hypothetical protein
MFAMGFLVWQVRAEDAMNSHNAHGERNSRNGPAATVHGRIEMERQEPYIGTGTPPPIREQRSRSPALVSIAAVVVVLLCAAAAAYFFWLRDRTLPAPPGPVAVPASPTLPTAQAPLHPMENAPAEQPLPELKASDGPVAAAISALVGLDSFGRIFVGENLVRNIVATIDNLPREEVSQRVNPLRPVPGVPVTTGKGAVVTLAPANALRYAPHMRLVETVGTEQLVAFYRRHYPLFQQAYVELGYPGGYFNDRVVEAIDDLLATPEVPGPIRLTQPKVLYEFADPALEERSAGQKMMLRIGKDDRERVRAKLREIRAAIVAR